MLHTDKATYLLTYIVVTGSSDAPPTTLDKPCEYDSCPAGSPPTGSNSSDPHLNYVNSYAVTSIKHGINNLAPKFFNAAPDLAVTGPNHGNNIGIAVPFSATIGASTYAAHNASIPTIAFSGMSGSPAGWNETAPLSSKVYADLSANVTDHLIASGTPYLPKDIWLNVNYGAVSEDKCAKAEDFKFVLSRIHEPVPLVTGDDVETCGSKRLPAETKVVLTPGCYASVSVGVGSNKTDADAATQKVVLHKLGNLFTCLP